MLAVEATLDVDDLEADNRPEDLMVSYVSGEKGKDRSNHELRFHWKMCFYLLLFQPPIYSFHLTS